MTRPVSELRSLSPALGTVAVLAGIAGQMLGTVLVVLIAARVLDAEQYTVFSAFAALWGVLISAPGGAFEQETTVHAAAGGTAVVAGMVRRAAAYWAVLAVFVAVPLGWQTRLMGETGVPWAATMIAGAAVALVVAIGRGSRTGQQRFAAVGALSVAIGVATLAVPLLLLAGGVSPLTAFIVGNAAAWLVGLPVLLVGRRPRSAPPVTSPARPPQRATVGLVVGNMLMLAAVLAVPAVLRWHAEVLGAAVTADLQLVVNFSRLASTAVLVLIPFMISTMAPGARTRISARTWLLVAGALAAVAVVATVVAGNAVLEWITGRTSSLDPTLLLVGSLPVMFLAPALVAMAVAASRQRTGLIIAAWAAALAVLLVPGLALPSASALVLQSVIVASALTALTVFGVGLMRRER